MASLTVRQLDDALKKRLRLRAARNGRSVEDEVRTILRSAAADGEAFAAAPEPTLPREACEQIRQRREESPAHHRRRDRGLQIARPDPAAARARHRGARRS